MRPLDARPVLRPGVASRSHRRFALGAAASAILTLVPALASALPGFEHDLDTPDRAYRRLFIAPRAYPDSSISRAARDTALSRLALLPPVFLPVINGAPPIWKSIGPTNVGGRVTDLAIDPTNPARWFATSVGGVWRTEDSGHLWKRVSDPDASGGMLPGVFGAVVVVPGSGEVIVGGGDPNRYETDRSGGPGLWHSTNHGDSWQKETAPADLDLAVVFRLRVDAARNVYAATSKGLYRRLVSSAPTWDVFPNMHSPTCDLLVDDRTSPPGLEVANYQSVNQFRPVGILQYSTATANWSVISPSSPSFSGGDPGVIALARAPSNPQVLYARVSRRGSPDVWRNTLLGVYRSDDNGQSWSDVTPVAATTDAQIQQRTAACKSSLNVVTNAQGPPYAGYSNSLAVDPMDDKLVYCGGMRMLRSEDSGRTWCLLNVSANANYHDDPALSTPMENIRNSFGHDDVHAIVFDASVTPRRVIVGDDSGVHGLINDPQDFYWIDLNHGLNVTEFYRLATQEAQQSITAGGTQDNGPLVTYGNRTWFVGRNSDTAYIGIDAAHLPPSAPPQYGATVFGNSGFDEDQRPGPINVWPSVFPGIATPGTRSLTSRGGSDFDPFPPVASSTVKLRNFLAYARKNTTTDPIDNATHLVRTVDGSVFTDVLNSAIPSGDDATAIAAIDGSQELVGWYAGYANDPPPTGSVDAGIQACQDLTVASPFVRTKTALTERPNGVAVNPNDPLRAVVACGFQGVGKLWVTKDGGANWTPTSYSSPCTGVAWDPFDPNVIWIATDVGVLRAQVSGTTVGSFETCMGGLPGPISVNDISSSKSGTVTIGTMGFGAYQIDLAPDAITQDVALCVRDDVFDHGKPFQAGMPDPEHPVADPSDPGFWIAASGGAGLQFWNSTDIRIDVRARSKPKNMIGAVDNVSFESTPTELDDGFPGTIVDRTPQPGDTARVLVQVTNLGSKPAHNARVSVMWCDPTVGPLTLPSDYWTATYPTPSSSCGTLNASSGWHAISDPAGAGCVVIGEIRPEMPEVAEFQWIPQASVPRHVCLVAFVESVEDPLESALRGQLDVATLVTQSRHFAQRNLYPVDSSLRNNTELAHLPPGERPFLLRFDRPWLDHTTRLAVILPPGTHGPIHGMHTEARNFPLTREMEKMHLNWSTMFVTDSTWSTIDDVRLNKGTPHSMLVVYGRGSKSPRLGERFMIRTEQWNKVLGGATWVLRPGITASKPGVPRKGS